MERKKPPPKSKRNGNPDWKPGVSANPNGRAKGTPNKSTRIMREAVILAMEAASLQLKTRELLSESGVVGYLTHQAINEPVAFLAFASKAVLPLQIKHDLGMDNVIEVRFRKIEEVRMEFKRRGLPIPTGAFQLEHYDDVAEAEIIGEREPNPRVDDHSQATPIPASSPSKSPEQN
jgi:hypothetical protein